MSNFEVLSKDDNCHARCGVLTTAHGCVKTPVFMPVGTGGAVKGVTPRQLEEIGTEIILANTYHLRLRPGVDTVEKLGGLHKIMAWNKPILTDSGGYQVFSLSPLAKIDENGVRFTSHVDGAKVILTPEIATEIQNRLGADIIMCFDECPAFGCSDSHLRQAVERTIRWAGQCKQAHVNSEQLLFGIVQGGINPQLREHCAVELVKIDFDGYAIGGLSVGEGHEHMINMVTCTNKFLPEQKVRYLMGVGMPADIIAAVKAGVDMFDCVLPTRNGRNAFAFTEDGPIRLRNSSHTDDTRAVEESCDCYCCQNYSRGAIRHYFNTSEMLGPILLSLHNIRFFHRLMVAIRQAITENRYDQWSCEQLEKWQN